MMLSVRNVMTPEQVAAFLQVTPRVVYGLIRRRELAAYRVGRSYRVSREDLDAYLDAHRTVERATDALFDDVLAFGPRVNPQVDADQLLEELERFDRERHSSAS
jgi:excisionase family DNA binding protein